MILPENIKSEKELQRLIYLELNRLGLFFAWSRTDKRTTSTVGNPDFVFPYRGRYISVEVKLPKKKLSVEQYEVRKKIEREGGLFYVVTSFSEFLDVFNGL